MPDQTSSEYKNTPAIIDISALTKQSESKTQLTNDYYRTNATEESRTEMSDTEAAEEKLLKPPDTEWSPITEHILTKHLFFVLKQVI